MRRSVTYILSQVDSAVAFEWIADNLDPELVELRFILLNPADSALETSLRGRGLVVERVTYRGFRDLLRALMTTMRILIRWRPDTVHAHLLAANLVGLTAARLTGVRQRIHTRHHSTFHHRYAPQWVLVDRLINSLSTNIVAISRNVYEVLTGLEKVEKARVHLIHHGFRAEDFEGVSEARVRRVREKYDLEDATLVVGVIARYVGWKGHEHVVGAAKTVLEQHPGAVFVFANASGGDSVREIVHTLPPDARREIIFEEDLFALYGVFDIHVHVPIDPNIEAFGQTYVEALMAGVPAVFTLSGVAPEFIVDRRNALVVPHGSPTEIAAAIDELVKSPALRERLVEQGRSDVADRFSLEGMVEALQGLYSDGAATTVAPVATAAVTPS